MSDLKISELTPTSTVVDADEFAVVHNGDTSRLSYGNLKTKLGNDLGSALISSVSDTSTVDLEVSVGGDLTATVKDNSITYAKIQDISVTKRVLGRNTAGAGDAEEVTQAQLFGWGDWLNEVAEANSTPVTTDTDLTITNTRRYAFFTLPTTEKWYVFTGLEWFNGATVAGSVLSGVDLVDANPPVAAGTPLIAWGVGVTMSGANSVQRTSMISSTPVRGGTIVGAWINTGSVTANFKHQTGAGAQNQQKTIINAAPPTSDGTAWTSATNRIYLKIYFRGIK